MSFSSTLLLFATYLMWLSIHPWVYIDLFLFISSYTFFYKKLGSAPSTKSFLISHENFAIIVLKVFLIGFLFSEAKLHHCLDVEHFWMDINTKRALL